MSLSVGVVVPAYNAERFICQALDSVVAQEYQPEKIVVVDDGSSDDTARVVKNWAQNCPIEFEFLSQKNSGCGAARNAGIERLDMDLIALLDADDVWKTFHLKRSIEAFVDYPELILCFADHQKFDETGEIILASFFKGKEIERLSYQQQPNGLRVLSEGLFLSLIGGNYIPPSTTVFSRKHGELASFFDEQIRNCEDRDFALRLSKIGPFGYFQDIHANYRVHDNNITHIKNRLPLERYAFLVIKKMLGLKNSLQLSQIEIDNLESALKTQAETVLYISSKSGVIPYLKIVAMLFNAGVISPTLNPKHLLRSFLPTFRD